MLMAPKSPSKAKILSRGSVASEFNVMASRFGSVGDAPSLEVSEFLYRKKKGKLTVLLFLIVQNSVERWAVVPHVNVLRPAWPVGRAH